MEYSPSNSQITFDDSAGTEIMSSIKNMNRISYFTLKDWLREGLNFQHQHHKSSTYCLKKLYLTNIYGL